MTRLIGVDTAGTCTDAVVREPGGRIVVSKALSTPDRVDNDIAAEKTYYDAWAAVRAVARGASPYWPFIDSWSSDAFAGWVAAVARLLAANPSGAIMPGTGPPR